MRTRKLQYPYQERRKASRVNVDLWLNVVMVKAAIAFGLEFEIEIDSGFKRNLSIIRTPNDSLEAIPQISRKFIDRSMKRNLVPVGPYSSYQIQDLALLIQK